MLEKVIFLTPMNMPNISDYFGSSFVTGTDGNWRTSPTLANILRSCNPTLTGDERDYDEDKDDYYDMIMMMTMTMTKVEVEEQKI